MSDKKPHGFPLNETDGKDYRFREIAEVLPMPVFITDTEGCLTYFNPAAVQFSERKPELGSDQWPGNWKFCYRNGKPMPHEKDPVAGILKEGGSINGEEVIAERPGGRRIWFEVYSSPLHDEQEKVIGGIHLLIDVTERKQADKQHQRNEQKLNDFFENATQSLHWVGPNGIILRANQTELDMLGYSHDEYVGRHIADFYVEKEVIDDILRRLKAGEELHDYEARMRCRDGSIKHVLISSNVFREGGEFIHTRCITRDITERKKTEKELAKVTAESEWQRRLYETIISNTPDLMYVFDLNYRFIFANEAILDMWGRALEESIGKRLLEVGYEPWHAEMHEREIDQVIAAKKPVRGEVPFPHARLGQRIYDYILVPVFNDRGDVEAVAGTTRDITERKQNEHSNALLGAIIENSNDAIISKNLDGIITSWNPGAERMFGYTAEEVTDQPVTILIPPDRLDEETEILERLKRGEKVSHFETIRLRKDGTPLEVSLTISPIRNSSDQIIGASKIARDITRQKEAEEKLKKMNETLEKRVEKRTSSLLSYQDQLRSLASELSKAEERERQRLATDLHDNLGQILAVGKMNLDLLQSQKHKLPDGAASDVAELADLVNDAIRYTRDLMSDLKPPPSLDKKDLVANIRWLADKMEKHDLEVSIKDDGQPKQLSEEIRTTLRQCVRELLFNVLKHAGVNEARVVLSSLKDEVLITVEDEGKGFNMKGKIPAPTEDGGFGLFNIHERMDMLGGSLEIISKPGKGSKLILRVPNDEIGGMLSGNERTVIPISKSDEQSENHGLARKQSSDDIL